MTMIKPVEMVKQENVDQRKDDWIKKLQNDRAGRTQRKEPQSGEGFGNEVQVLMSSLYLPQSCKRGDKS